MKFEIYDIVKIYATLHQFLFGRDREKKPVCHVTLGFDSIHSLLSLGVWQPDNDILGPKTHLQIIGSWSSTCEEREQFHHELPHD